MINYAPLNELVPWCSGLTCGPVKAEIAGSNPVGTAKNDAKEPIKKVGFLLFNADFALNFAGFFSYTPRVRKTAFSDRTRDLA